MEIALRHLLLIVGLCLVAGCVTPMKTFNERAVRSTEPLSSPISAYDFGDDRTIFLIPAKRSVWSLLTSGVLYSCEVGDDRWVSIDIDRKSGVCDGAAIIFIDTSNFFVDDGTRLQTYVDSAGNEYLAVEPRSIWSPKDGAPTEFAFAVRKDSFGGRKYGVIQGETMAFYAQKGAIHLVDLNKTGFADLERLRADLGENGARLIDASAVDVTVDCSFTEQILFTKGKKAACVVGPSSAPAPVGLSG